MNPPGVWASGNFSDGIGAGGTCHQRAEYPRRDPPALTYRAAIDLPATLADQLAELLHAHTSKWRRLGPNDRAVLTLAYLRKNETYEALAAGFGVGTATAWRYVQEAVVVLAALAPNRADAVATADPDQTLLVDGSAIPTDRFHVKGFWSGEHHPLG